MLDRPRLVNLVEYRHKEGRSLAGSGLRAGHDVTPPAHDRYSVLLHWRRLVVPSMGYVRAHYLRQVNILKLKLKESIVKQYEHSVTASVAQREWGA